MILRFILLVLFGFILVGCAASGPAFQQYSSQSPESAVVYIYRPSRSVNCCVAPAVYINDSKRDSLKNGGYLAYELGSGVHKIVVGDGAYGFTAETLELNLEKGKHYFLKWNIGPIENIGDIVAVAMLGSATAGKREYNLVQMNSGVAKAEISSLKLSAP